MPTYVFQYDDGSTVDQFYSMADAPKIGDVVTINGRKATRIPHFHLDAAGIERKTHKYPYISNSLPSTIRGCDYAVQNGRKKPVIRSQSHEREIAARYDYVKD